jgi:DNA-binding NarL/FixJ family response regulator
VEESVAATKSTAERITEACNQYKLTQREKELIELIYSGKTNKEIAEMLFLAESTVKTHVYNIFRKMEVKNRIEVICIINGDAIEHEKMNIYKERVSVVAVVVWNPLFFYFRPYRLSLQR